MTAPAPCPRKDAMNTEDIPHGRLRYRRGCRCATCRAGAAADARRRWRLRAYGQWQPFVDAEPVRQHVLNLAAAGMGSPRVAVAAGVSHATVSRLLWGDRGNGYPKTKTIRTETAAKLLAVKPDLALMAPGAKIDSTVSRRHIGAMLSLGWSLSRIGRELGLAGTNVGHMLRMDRITVANALAIRKLYQRWGFTPPAPRTPQEKRAVTLAKKTAARHGFVSALAWNNIDDPAEVPAVDATSDDEPDAEVVRRLIAGVKTPARHVDRIEAARRMSADGKTDSWIADRCGMSHRTVRKIMEAAA